MMQADLSETGLFLEYCTADKKELVMFLTENPYPVDIVLHPRWWYRHEGITFDRDFFYDSRRRVEAERMMERSLYQRWGKFGIGTDWNKDIPWLGAVHLAAGYLVSEMLGCQVRYLEKDPPLVVSAEGDYPPLSIEKAFSSSVWKDVEELRDSLVLQYGYVKGDINWGGILNTALDLEGQNLFIKFFNDQRGVTSLLGNIAQVIEKFISIIAGWTGTTSLSVNRSTRLLSPSVYLHSECSHTMISVEDYERFLKSFDQKWTEEFQPYGIHYCGKDPHRYAESWSGLSRLDFLDVGAGGDPAVLRKYLPDTFLNLRLDPVVLVKQTPAEISETIYTLAEASADPMLTGFCCINIDDTVSEEQISAIFETIETLREEVLHE